RAHSHYWFRRNDGREKRTLLEVLADEQEAPHAESSYLIRPGLYSMHLARYYSKFDTRQILVLLFGDLVGRSAATLRTVQGFLNVEVLDLELPRVNAAARPRIKAYQTRLNAFAS